MSVTTYYLQNGAIIELGEDEAMPIAGYAPPIKQTLPCNWCTEPVPVNDFGVPYNGHYRQYERRIAIYCCYECSIREYDFLFEHNPESPEVAEPVPESLRRYYLQNH